MAQEILILRYRFSFFDDSLLFCITYFLVSAFFSYISINWIHLRKKKSLGFYYFVHCILLKQNIFSDSSYFIKDAHNRDSRCNVVTFVVN